MDLNSTKPCPLIRFPSHMTMNHNENAKPKVEITRKNVGDIQKLIYDKENIKVGLEKTKSER